jgi:hypothetical protein
MRRIVVIPLLLMIATGIMFTACSSLQKAGGSNRALQVEETPAVAINIDSLTPGFAVYNAATVHYNRAGKQAYAIQFKTPVVVDVATKVEKWGYFQFPTIDRLPNDAIRVRWNLNDDAMEAYGNHKFGEAVSSNKGASFQLAPQHTPLTGLVLPNGERLTIHTPKPIPAAELQLPEAIGGSMDTYTKSTTNYYRMQGLPAKAQGIYFDRLTAGETSWKTVPATLTDPQAARYTLRGNLPIIWWGDMHLAADKSIVAGVYPGFYVGTNGKADPFHHIFFYRSTDNGNNWNIQGRIFYKPNLTIDIKGEKRMGFTEPGYEVLPDGTMICVVRTTDGIGNGPMYVSRSTDNGATWSQAEIMTPSGVLPRLLQLENGVLVMSSGRPGVQLRFSKDGKGQAWSNAFEMLPWIDYKDQVSCGYTGLLATGPDRFLLVYSDFRYLNDAGQVRKAIKVREVIVTPE